MSGQALNGPIEVPVGFYGKFPNRGDFVTRHLPMEFVRPWDAWLQSAIEASREQMREAWLDNYLTSPLWRFVLSSGLCGANRWAGVMMPSVDRVGRYFPLTIVSSVPATLGIAYLLSSASSWFDQIEDLALSALENSFNLDHFETSLAQLQLPVATGNPNDTGVYDSQQTGKAAFQVGMNNPGETPQAFVGLSEMLLQNYLPSFSLWSSAGSERVERSLIACEGLPPLDAYSAFLTGDWRQRGWKVRTGQVQTFSGAARTAQNARLTEIPPPNNESDQSHQTEPYPREFEWTSYGLTDVGKKRKINEDALLVDEKRQLWIVADGMGGHKAGDRASKMVTGAFGDVQLANNNVNAAVSQICSRLKQINRDLFDLAAAEYDNQVVGTTVVALTASRNQCGFVWAGDSRIYRLRGDRLVQLTRDHALFEEQEETGQESTTAETPANSDRSNIITRAVGAESELELDSQIIDVEDGDTFLLCSDGLIKEIETKEIEELLASGSSRECVDRLMQLALQRNARDNVTVIVVQARIP